MFEAYKYYWQNAFKYRAVSSRADFWWPVLVNFIILVILYFLLAIAGYTTVSAIMHGYNSGGFVVFLLFIIAAFAVANILPAIAICVRRLRDTGLTGWTVLVYWLLSILFSSNNSSILNSLLAILEIIMLVLLCLPSGYINKHGWWSPNYTNDVKIPSLQGKD
ncbi:DUF805 domain-containing protein [Limosilactobacillus caviae]|uniref:DUF805 domain-containing protein n=1 Tax=Limosilactobacillus caviae TaxID=1769424 RepID=UPI003517A2CF